MKNNFIESRKSQVTVFIIIGIVLVFGAVAFFLLRREVAELPAEVVVAEKTPTEFAPLKDFVESCLNQKLKEAFVLIGQHGGYIDMSDAELSRKVFVLRPDDPTSSDAAFFTPHESSSVAYWWYLQSDNKCGNCRLTNENRPSLEYVQQQSNLFIDRNVQGCIDGFRGFERQGFKVDELAPPSAETKVTEDEVVVLLTYPINATLGDKSAKLTQYYAKIPLGFREFYGLASAIMYAEINTSFLESVPKQILGAYGSGADSSRLPPIFAREESYVPKFWSRTVVENAFRSLLTSHVPLLSMEGTRNAVHITSPDPLVDGLYRLFYQNYSLGRGYGNFSVSFYYLGWPIYFYVGPGRGELLSATRVMDIPIGIGPIVAFPSPPIREYAFFYDISYPVIVELRRDSDLFGEGYSFFFALESNLRNNLDIRQWMGGYGTYSPNIVDDFTWVSAFERELPETAEEAERTVEESTNISTREGKSLFCNPNQRISGNMTFVAVDKFTGEELDGVTVKFGCGMYDLCSIGVTGFVLEQNKSLLTSRLPFCLGGGTLKFAKTGYLDEVLIDLTVDKSTTQEFKVEMTQMIEKNVTVVKQLVNRTVIYWRPYENHGRDYTKRLVLSPQTLSPSPENDSIIVTIRKVDINPLVSFQSQLVSLDSTMNSTKIKLAPGAYEVKGMFIGLKGANITPSLRCKTQDDYNTYVSSKEGECYYLPEDPVMLQQTIAGGIDLNNETGYWTVDPSDLLSDNHIELKVLELPKPLLIEDLDEMGLVANLTQEYRPQLEPVFVSN